MSKLVIAALALLSTAAAQAHTNKTPHPYEEVFYTSGSLRIEAYVYKPQGDGPFPVVIYNHGSRPSRERVELPFTYVGKMLAASGYIALVPERRGYGRSDGAQFSQEIGDDRGPRYVARLQQEADDVIAATEFAKTLPNADGSRVAVMVVRKHCQCICGEPERRRGESSRRRAELGRQPRVAVGSKRRSWENQRPAPRFGCRK